MDAREYAEDELDELQRREDLAREAISNRQAAIADVQQRLPLLQQQRQQLEMQQHVLDALAFQQEIAKVAAENRLEASRRRLADCEKDRQATLAAAAQLDREGASGKGGGPIPDYPVRSDVLCIIGGRGGMRGT